MSSSSGDVFAEPKDDVGDLSLHCWGGISYSSISSQCKGFSFLSGLRAKRTDYMRTRPSKQKGRRQIQYLRHLAQSCC